MTMPANKPPPMARNPPAIIAAHELKHTEDDADDDGNRAAQHGCLLDR
jgi:dienelactone hydrolase